VIGEIVGIICEEGLRSVIIKLSQPIQNCGVLDYWINSLLLDASEGANDWSNRTLAGAPRAIDKYDVVRKLL
jgi:hypothetical protein